MLLVLLENVKRIKKLLLDSRKTVKRLIHVSITKYEKQNFVKNNIKELSFGRLIT